MHVAVIKTETYQVEVSLKWAKLWSLEILSKYLLSEKRNISNTKCSTRAWPMDDRSVAFGFQHFVQLSWELLWYSTATCSRIVRLINHDCCLIYCDCIHCLNGLSNDRIRILWPRTVQIIGWVGRGWQWRLERLGRILFDAAPPRREVKAENDGNDDGERELVSLAGWRLWRD